MGQVQAHPAGAGSTGGAVASGAQSGFTAATLTGHAAALEARILEKTARIGVIGLGYVGLPLAIEFARKGFQTVGIDLDHRKISALERGENYIQDISDAHVLSLIHI